MSFPVADVAYRDYLSRYERALGKQTVGAYAKWNGFMIRKLAPEEYVSRTAEYRALQLELERSTRDGQTLSNRLVKQLREKAAELVLTGLE